jgi:hypothetical protein
MKTVRRRVLQLFLGAVALTIAGGLYAETHRIPDQS